VRAFRDPERWCRPLLLPESPPARELERILSAEVSREPERFPPLVPAQVVEKIFYIRKRPP